MIVAVILSPTLFRAKNLTTEFYVPVFNLIHDYHELLRSPRRVIETTFFDISLTNNFTESLLAMTSVCIPLSADPRLRPCLDYARASTTLGMTEGTILSILLSCLFFSLCALGVLRRILLCVQTTAHEDSLMMQYYWIPHAERDGNDIGFSVS
ncbi:MAG: hypothetical protein V2J62_10290 [candidate division KSB1 bacterium]|jgi:hypothetical protein|nr:hypothetical protein [candidate division KSB1 bacterium]